MRLLRPGGPAPTASAADDAGFPRWRQSVGVIALGAFLASGSMNFWVPFLPVYMKRLGAESDAQALAWVGVAYTGTGIARLVGGPLWGVLADRYGRKAMFLRSLFAASATMLIAAVATAPWHVVVAWTCQGLLSGFIPAAVALTSVSVPRGRLTSALGSVQGGQYIGNMVGPVAGAVLASTFGLRGAVVAGALIPALAGVVALLAVPRDAVTRADARVLPIDGEPARRESRLTTFTGGLSAQLGVGLLLYFTIHMTGGLVRTAAPIALDRFSPTGSVTSLTGWVFAAGGLASAVGALGLGRLLRSPRRLRVALTSMTGLSAGAYVLLSLAGGPVAFGAAYALIGLCQGAMVPATNTVIAAAVPYERRGAAFGLASSVQALAFVVGPISGAYFATVSLTAGFMLLGVLVGLVALVTLVALRAPDTGEPRTRERVTVVEREPSKV